MSEEPPRPGHKPDRTAFGWGVVVGLAPVLANLLALSLKRKLPGNLSTLIGCLLLWPVLGVILAAIKPTSRFGLGMLLGVGASWLTLLAICGGLIAFSH